jgi:hypothetical protein
LGALKARAAPTEAEARDARLRREQARNAHDHLLDIYQLARSCEEARDRYARLLTLVQSRKYQLLHCDWRALRGTPFEDFLQQVFERLGYSVQTTKASGDQGIDLITLDSTAVAASYGFVVSGDGVGAATWNVGSAGDAFGVANSTTLTVMDLLLATDDQAINGLLYNGNAARRNGANAVYSALNQAGSIS